MPTPKCKRLIMKRSWVVVCIVFQAPPRADVVKGLRSGIMVNLVGMGAAILGMQATVGFLVAKALTTSASPFYQGVSQGYSPVLALDVFLVQAFLAHMLLSYTLLSFFYYVANQRLVRFLFKTYEGFCCRHRQTPCFLIS